VKNPALQGLYDLMKNHLRCSTSDTMFQRIPAQFCEMISRIGFHAECAPPEGRIILTKSSPDLSQNVELQPDRFIQTGNNNKATGFFFLFFFPFLLLVIDPAYGEGIYFARTVKKAMDLWKQKKDEYLYFMEAEVLTGNSTPGKPGLILPPPVGSDPGVIYDSVTGGGDTSVVFSGYQALPTYIITCKRM